MLKSTCLGFPRIGAERELKKATESFWAGGLTAQALEAVGRDLRAKHWSAMKRAGMTEVPTNDFSFYDQVLDTAVMFGAIAPRYAAIDDPLSRTFAMARGLQDAAAGVDVPALEMTKWFDTNYHYIVPELSPAQVFQLDASRVLREIDEARACGVEPRPIIIGPITFLHLSKLTAGAAAGTSTLDLVATLLPCYDELLGLLARHGVAWVQLDEPVLTLDLDARTREAFRWALRHISARTARPKVLLATYFGALNENLDLALQSGCEALHLDLVRAPEQLEAALPRLDARTVLSLGLIDGRNIWRADLDAALKAVTIAVDRLGRDRVSIASSCSLLHVPVDLSVETRLDDELKTWLAFATQKLDEIVALAAAGDGQATCQPAFEAARAALGTRRASTRTHDAAVRTRTASVTAELLRRRSGYRERARRQRERFGLPPLPTTTIGSFPQTRQVREARASWRAGRIDDQTYTTFLREETRRCVVEQEELGIDVLVHGEFERTDMAEYFGERLDGFAFTRNGWVQSYGSRCVKPPIIFGDVSRPLPMTVEWTRYAQSLTKKPMKGMLTGPVTILQWSFVRDDQPRGETCFQIALALRDEVADLEAAGVGMIQVDEPAIREGLPPRRQDHAAYLRWAVDAFRLATAGVRDATQIHTHMCYAEFGDILDAIGELDADVLSIETSRSKMELFHDFGRTGYANEVGPGVYDIHAPRVPTIEEMDDLLARAARVLPIERLWVNPDCGLKTRGWPEVRAALTNMVESARRARRALVRGAPLPSVD